MGMRFTLFERTEDGTPLQPRRVPSLRRWRKSRPGRAAYGIRQRVRNLVEGSAYRMRVQFRWYDAEGKVIQHSRRRSGFCRQFGPRPNLKVTLLQAERTDVPKVLRYFVHVTNVGRAGAHDAGVTLAVDGREVNTKAVALLRRAETRTVTFQGPACTGRVDARADPANLIPESSETDNSDSRPCAEIRP
jgi:CARDB